jgi:acetyl-CoA carboxylase carboxyl transferase subunit alpha
MAKVVLEFEKPIIELEQKIDEMRKYSDNLDISDEIKKLEKKVDQLRHDDRFHRTPRRQVISR